MSQKNAYRAVYVPQVPMVGFTVEADTLMHAAMALEVIVHLSIFEFEYQVKPDYSDYASIEVWNDDDEDWEDVEEEDWPDVSQFLQFSTPKD